MTSKAQKLRWIERVMTIMEGPRFIYTCDAFHFVSSKAYHWYWSVIERYARGQLYPFADVNQNDRNAARLTWLCFLWHWVSEGEIE